MLVHFLKFIYRHLSKYKFYSLLNFSGLTLGFLSFILISLFIKYEYDWDKHNQNYDRIYRIQTYKTIDDQSWMQTSPAVSAYIKNRYNDIEKQAVVLHQDWEYLSLPSGKLFQAERGLYAEQDYLDIFTFNFIQGAKKNALRDPFSIILSKSFAERMFPGENPIGKTILHEKKYPLKITGIYNDLPFNSHLRPDYIISFLTLETTERTKNVYERWNQNAYYTYVLLKKGADYRYLNHQIKDILKEHITTDYRQLYLVPLSALYLNPTNNNYVIVMYIFMIFAAFILFLTAINYINVSIAKSTLRTKEIGIKKACGCSKFQLITNLLSETILLALFSLILAVLLVEITLPFFNQIINKDIPFSSFFNGGFYLIILGITLSVSILAGLHPAYLTASVNSTELFRKKIFTDSRSRISLKKILVFFQYVIAVILITITLFMSKQIQYMLTKDVGFDKENLLFLEITPSRKGITLQHLKSRLSQIPGIQSMAFSRAFPCHSTYWFQNMINWQGAAPGQVADVQSTVISHDFIKTLGMDIFQGRGFSNQFPTDIIDGCIVNETAVRTFGWNNPLGKVIDNGRLKVVGVIKDFHAHDMYNVIPPVVYTVRSDEADLYGSTYYLAFRTTPGSEIKMKKIINDALIEVFPEDPFVIKLFTDYFKSTQIFKIFYSINRLFIFCSIIVAFLAVMGVISLVTFSLNRRTKEIAIRKINGCSSASMFQSITTEYIVLIGIAGILGGLIAHIIYQMLPIYYAVQIHIWDYFIAILLTLIFTLLAIGYKIVQETNRNPVEALRYE